LERLKTVEPLTGIGQARIGVAKGGAELGDFVFGQGAHLLHHGAVFSDLCRDLTAENDRGDPGNRKDIRQSEDGWLQLKFAAKLAEGGNMDFSDADAISDYAVADIAAVVRAGIVRGNADGTLNPLGNTTRAETAVIMQRILDR